MGETEKKAFFLLQSFRLFPGLLQWGTGKSGEKLFLDRTNWLRNPIKVHCAE